MFDAKVYRVMIGSLSGAMEEVYAAKETIRKWNIENAEQAGRVYLPVEWDTNAEAVKNVDVVIGIVGNWIGNTSYIEDYIKAGKHVMLFFNGFYDQKNTIPSEHDEVISFKDKIQNCCACSDYDNISGLSIVLNEKLETI